MSETPLHSDLVASLLSKIASEVAAVTHAAGRPEYPDPPKVGRHEPDLYLLTDDGLLVLGEAKIGPDLTEERAQQQIADFCAAVGPNRERATVATPKKRAPSYPRKTAADSYRSTRHRRHDLRC
jgi:hypothetical protein